MKLFSDDEINFIMKNYPIKGSRWVADKIGKSYKQIQNKVRKLRINKDPFIKRLPAIRNKLNVNANDFITIKRPEEAYILGMVWADGFIYVRPNAKSAVLRLEILKNDMDKISQLFTLSGKWYIGSRHRKGRQEQGIVECTNRKLILFLQSLGYKSGRINPENVIDHIPKEFLQYWLRGYFDGDGCVYYNEKLHLKQLSISASYEYYWKPIENIFNAASIKCNIKQRIQGKNRHSLLLVTGIHNIEKFKQLVYSNRLDIGIQRKHIKLEEIIKNKIREM